MIQVNKGHCSRDASMKKNEIHPVDNKLLSDVRQIIDTARANAIRSVDFSRVTMYWNLGRRIFEEEQLRGRTTRQGPGGLWGENHQRSGRTSRARIWKRFFVSPIGFQPSILQNISNCERAAFTIKLDSVQVTYTNR